ncbi:MAG: HTH domain-containing protein [Bacteroidota bacterium]
MKALEQLERLQRMNQLIKAEKTGSPDEFSQFLGISRRQLYTYIENIKDMGADICYSKNRRTFYFCNGDEIEISYSFKIISRDLSKRINGGFFQKYFNVLFLCTEQN